METEYEVFMGTEYTAFVVKLYSAFVVIEYVTFVVTEYRRLSENFYSIQLFADRIYNFCRARICSIRGENI